MSLGVLDGLEDRPAFAAPVLKRHRLGPKERDDLGVLRVAVRAARLRAGLVSRWAARTSSPPVHEACRKCARRWRLGCRACALRPIASSRCRRGSPSSPAALPDGLAISPRQYYALLEGSNTLFHNY